MRASGAGLLKDCAFDNVAGASIVKNARNVTFDDVTINRRAGGGAGIAGSRRKD